ncbi:MAG: M2 family metallopeptidase [Prolixibacteraceae bacterium]|nr:M2 family metallopeptidase [Prolixibacteraceae bacterium]
MKYLLLFLVLFSVSCLNEKQQSEMILRHYIDKNVDLIRNFTKESTVALWNVNLSGNERDYMKLINLELDFNNTNQSKSGLFSPDKFTPFTENVFTKEKDFELLKRLKNSELITDTMLKRQLTVLYQSFMGPQVEANRYRKLRFAETKLWQSFSAIKVELEGKKYAGGQLDSIRKNSTDTTILKKVYTAYREKGRQIAGDIIQMVKMRNEFARDFGYTDYYQLAVETKDQTPEKIKILLNEIELKTNDQFYEAKALVDKVLSKKYHIRIQDLRCYHYNDERSSYLPRKFSDKMDSLYRKDDPIVLAAQFFSGLGLPVQDVIEKSDLKYRSGKSAGTSIFNVDFKNDLRMLATIKDNADGMKKIMHLCGHASHFKNISDNVPYLLKDPNSVVAEGVASFFESLTMNNLWLKDEFEMDSVSNREYKLLCMHFMQVDRLYRFRRLLVKSVFEREIYRNPDQNLGALWYRLNEEYLGIRPPNDQYTTDWATASYFTSLSCSVHNFVLADLFAGQLQHYIEKNILDVTNPVYQNNKSVGQYLVTQLYRFGDLLPWEQLIEKSTGEPLNPAYFAKYLTGGNEEIRVPENSSGRPKMKSIKH